MLRLLELIGVKRPPGLSVGRLGHDIIFMLPGADGLHMMCLSEASDASHPDADVVRAFVACPETGRGVE